MIYNDSIILFMTHIILSDKRIFFEENLFLILSRFRKSSGIINIYVCVL